MHNRKSSRFLKYIFIIFLLFGCYNKENSSYSNDINNNESVLEVSEIPLYFRDTSADLTNYSHQKIFSLEELNNYIEFIKVPQNVDLTKYSKYNNDFFIENFILTDLLHYKSSSIKLIAESYSYNGNIITINIKEVKPNNLAADIVTTIFLFEIPKGNLTTADIGVNINHS